MVDDGNGHTDVQGIRVRVDDVFEATGHSGKSHSGSHTKKVCKDSKATNFKAVGQHNQSLCKYAKEVKEKTEEKKEEAKQEVKEEIKTCSLTCKGLVRFGMKGNTVRELQQSIGAVVDGIMGNKTRTKAGCK